jgi:hypothetical protein
MFPVKEMEEIAMRRLALVLGLACAAMPAAVSGQLTTPADWKWRQDAPAPLAAGATMTPGSWVFVQMPPGWHITTGPGALLYPTTHAEADGNFSVEAEIHLFSGTSAEEFGVFLGGREIDSSATPQYAAFVIRRDGSAAVIQRRDGQTKAVADWQRNEAIVPHRGGEDTVKNVIRVDLDSASATMFVNGTKVVAVPRQQIAADGRIGFRVGKDLNLHITTLNVTRRLAPVPIKRG